MMNPSSGSERGIFPKWFAPAMVALLALIAVLLGVLVIRSVGTEASQTPGIARTSAQAADYQGTGADGTVTVIVQPGMTARDIANVLVTAGVVKSAQAYVDASNVNQRSMGIQEGTYTLHPHMSAAAAVQALISQKPAPIAGG